MPDPVQMLVDRIGTAGQVALAKELGVSISYLNDVLHRRRKPGPKVLKALGLERHTSYKKVTNGQA